MCIHEGCKINPSFNIDGEIKALYCLLHKKEGMIGVKSKKCIYKGCKTRSSFNKEGEGNSLYCSLHKQEGMIDVKEESFEITNIPLFDEAGNVSYIIGTINHSNFSDWNFDLQFNMEDDIRKINPLTKRNAEIEQFMVLNTKYKEGDIYYGKSFARGTVNIYGTESDLDVFVDLETKKNTEIVFPMYGASEIEQEEDFIHFVNKSQLQQQMEQRIDFTGINLDLNFKITQDAQMNLIFNEQIDDEIIARGDGEMNIKLDQLDQLTMT